MVSPPISWGICIHSCWFTSVLTIPSGPKYPSNFIADLHPVFIYDFMNHMYKHTFKFKCTNIIHVQYVPLCPMLFNPSPYFALDSWTASRSASHRSPAANWAAECWAQADQGRSPGRGHGQTWRIWSNGTMKIRILNGIWNTYWNQLFIDYNQYTD